MTTTQEIEELLWKIRGLENRLDYLDTQKNKNLTTQEEKTWLQIAIDGTVKDLESLRSKKDNLDNMLRNYENE